ncbi:Hypothetical_protein [Hexamita inflata]|uniref:Hypothetical_protein n=1 Tax=Hexamita inflata TaxID=28002 RepID=A0AA86VLK1_9EUKA|nr:Hypothetical protein HINF_LOCUS57843 [Hexamita inflata]
MIALQFSMQQCYYYLTSQFINQEFHLQFASDCHKKGDQLIVSFVPITQYEPTTFTKTVTIDEEQIAIVEFRCSEVIQDFPQCTEMVKNLKGNSSATVVIQQPDGGNFESFLNIFVEIEDVETTKGLKGWEIAIIVCCSVGAVVLIVVITCTVLYIKKKNAAMKLPLLQTGAVTATQVTN